MRTENAVRKAEERLVKEAARVSQKQKLEILKVKRAPERAKKSPSEIVR